MLYFTSTQEEERKNAPSATKILEEEDERTRTKHLVMMENTQLLTIHPMTYNSQRPPREKLPKKEQKDKAL